MLRTLVKRLSDYYGSANDDDEEDLIGVESRLAPRHEVQIPGVLQIGSAEFPCTIRSLSAAGMMVEAEGVSLCVGQQIVVTSTHADTLFGIVRWFRGQSFGAQFPTRIPLDVVQRTSRMLPSGRRARAGRARVRMFATAHFGSASRKVEVLNVSVGGIMLKSGLPFHSAQALMIEFPDMLPLGGHIRWSANGKSGFMFSKLLPIQAAQEIARRANINGSWLEEVLAAHSLLTQE